MGQIGFICSNGNRVSFADCLGGIGCPSGEECCHISIRKKAAESRPWRGIPSVTMLQNPTYISFLEITQDYYIYPTDRMFALFGTAVHSILEQDMERIASKFGWTGLPDWYMEDTGELIDFKVSSWYTMQDTVDKWCVQVNAYRILLEGIGKKVSRMRIQVICRDAKLTRGQSYIKWIEVPPIPDKEIIDEFNYKRDLLLGAIKSGSHPPVCPASDRWHNKKTGEYIRCKYYCDVRSICPYNTGVFE